MDLTTLAGDDTLANVQRLCFKAKQPIRQDLMAAMGLKDLGQFDVFRALVVSVNAVIEIFDC